MTRRRRFPAIALVFCAGVALTAGLKPAHSAEAKKGAQQIQAKREPLPKEKQRNLPPNRIGQGQIVAVIDGKPERAIELCQDCLEANPKHLESLYNLTIAWCRMGESDRALATMKRAIAAGLPPGRFIAGPRDLFRPLAETAEFQEFVALHVGRIVHGPMLGCVTDRSAKFWVRTAEEVSIQVVLSTSKEMTRPLKSATVFAEAGRDYTAVAEVEGLQPETVYCYDVLLKGKSTLGPEFPSFHTFPPAGRGSRFQVGFGGGAGYTPRHERMWGTIAAHKPAAFLFLGDNVYIDNPTRPDVQHYTYYRRQSRPEYRRFAASTSIFAIWDDHDFGTNDCWCGPEVDQPAWKPAVWRVFRNNWNNPAYGGGKRRPGCWFGFSIADVDFFMFDGRYYRTDPKQEHATMLGPVQKEWLLNGLKHSRATFKVLASPVPWVLEAKGKSLDTWQGFQAEREEVFSFLEKKRIDGVILISADRHRSDYWRIERENGYPLYEFESSRLTNIHTHPIMPGSLFGYNEKCSFGILTFDTTRPDPEVTYQIVSIDDELIHSVTLKESVLSHE